MGFLERKETPNGIFFRNRANWILAGSRRDTDGCGGRKAQLIFSAWWGFFPFFFFWFIFSSPLLCWSLNVEEISPGAAEKFFGATSGVFGNWEQTLWCPRRVTLLSLALSLSLLLPL